MRDVRLYYDFVSPYAWLGLMQAQEFGRAHGVRWVARPVVYAKLLDASGLVGPAESPSKRRYTFFDVTRCAQELRLRVAGPPAHPFRSIEALRVAALYLDDPHSLAVAVALADAAWGDGRDLTDVATLAEVVAGVGLDASNLKERISEQESKARLFETTSEAVERGVFGVPTFELRGELFWGHDRLPQLARRLAGVPAPAGALAERILARPRGTDRRRAPR